MLGGPARDLDERQAQRLGRERQRPRAHHLELRELGRRAPHEVESHLGAEARGGDAQARVAQRVRDAAVHGCAPEGAEPRTGADDPGPPVREADPFELGQRGEEVLRQLGVHIGALFEIPRDAVAARVEGVPATAEDALVFRKPVVVEQVAGVGQRLSLRGAVSLKIGVMGSTLPGGRRVAVPVRPGRARADQAASGGIAGPTALPVQPRGRRYEMKVQTLGPMARQQGGRGYRVNSPPAG